MEAEAEQSLREQQRLRVRSEEVLRRIDLLRIEREVRE